MRHLDLIKLVAAVLLTTFADRLAQLQLLAFVVMSGPSGEGSGSSALAWILPLVVFGFLFGALTDRLGYRRVLMAGIAARAILVIAIPMVIASIGASGATVAVTLSSLSAFTALGAIAVFSIIPQLAKNGRLQSGNAAAWCAFASGNLLATQLVNLADDQMIPTETLKVCAAVYGVALVAVWLIRVRLDSRKKKSESDIKSLFVYLRQHQGLLSFLQLSIPLTFIASLWLTTALALALENFPLSGIDLQQLLIYVVAGIIAGALLSVPAKKILSETSILCLSALGTGILALVLTCKLPPSTELCLICFIAASCALTLVTLDSVLQRLAPTSMRGKIAGIRLALVSLLSLLFTVSLEQFVVHLSGVALVKILASCTLANTVLLLFFWRDFALFLIASLVLAPMRSLFGYKIDGRHQLYNRGACLIALNNFDALNAALLTAAFVRPVKFLLPQSERKRAWFWTRAGALVSKKDKRATVERALRRGYTICFFLNKEDQELVKLATEQGLKVVPCLMQQTSLGRIKRSTAIRFGIPVEANSKLSEKDMLNAITLTSPAQTLETSR